MEVLIPILGVICAVGIPIGGTIFILYLLISNRHKERISLISQGIIPENQKKTAPSKYAALRNGILSIGLASGLIIGLVINYHSSYINDSTDFLVLTASTVMTLGISYLVFYLAVKDKDLDE